MGRLAVIDMVVVLIYLIGLIIFGFRAGRFIKDDTDYFLGGKNLPWWAIGMSMVVSDIGAMDIVGVAGSAYLYGIALANFEWIGCIPAMILAAFVFIPYYWRSGVFSVPEFLGRRYNQFVRLLVAFMMGFFMIFVLGVFFYAAGEAMHILMDIPSWAAILVVAFVVGVYTLFGGLRAVVLTDAVQCVIMFGGSAVILIGSLIKVGGWNALRTQVTALGVEYSNHFQLMAPMDTVSPYGWAGVIFGLSFVLSPAYWLGNQAIVQRTLGAKNEHEAKKSVLLGALLKLFIPFILVGPGIAGIILVPGLVKGDDVYPRLIHAFLPPGLTGLVFAAFLAALMSSLDSYLNSAATLWTKDIYQTILRPNESHRHYMIVGKVLICFFLLLGVSSAPLAGSFPSIYGYFQTIFSIFQGPLLAIILFGVLWWRTTSAGAVAALVLGISTSLTLLWVKDMVFTSSEPFLYIIWWSFCVSVVSVIAVSLVTRPESPEKLTGLVFNYTAPEDTP